jgi:hypothetical protein
MAASNGCEATCEPSSSRRTTVESSMCSDGWKRTVLPQQLIERGSVAPPREMA